VGNVEWTNSNVPLLKIFDPISKLNFIVDTGSQISVLPADPNFTQLFHKGFIASADGTKIPIYDEVELTLSFNFHRVFKWKFVYATVKYPILGIDFLRHYNLTVDLNNDCLIDLNSYCLTKSESVNNERPFKSLPSLNDVEINSVNDLCEVYEPIFDLNNFNQFRPNSVEHFIQTKGRPVFCKARRLSPERLLILKKELKTLLDLGIIEPATGPWASPLHLVKKGNPALFESREITDYLTKKL